MGITSILDSTPCCNPHAAFDGGSPRASHVMSSWKSEERMKTANSKNGFVATRSPFYEHAGRLRQRLLPAGHLVLHPQCQCLSVQRRGIVPSSAPYTQSHLASCRRERASGATQLLTSPRGTVTVASF